MAFENVNVGNLKSSLNDLKNSLSTELEQSLLDSFSNSQNFTTTAVNPIKEALEKLIHTRYKELDDMFIDYLKIAEMIETYQSKEKEIRRKEEQISREESKDNPNSSRINRLQREIRNLQREMDEIVKNVDSKLYSV